jgi:uncharacterized protein DUF3565
VRAKVSPQLMRGPSGGEYSRMVPERRIVGFHQDDEKNWVAELECGHTQHVRHTPPWQLRPWVLTPAGRASHLGTALPCRACGDTETSGGF